MDHDTDGTVARGPGDSQSAPGGRVLCDSGRRLEYTRFHRVSDYPRVSAPGGRPRRSRQNRLPLRHADAARGGGIAGTLVPPAGGAELFELGLGRIALLPLPVAFSSPVRLRARCPTGTPP